MFPPLPGTPFLPPPPPPHRPDHPLGPPPPPPDPFQPTGGFNLPSTPPLFANNASNFHIPAQSSSFNQRSKGNAPSGNLFGSQTATMTRKREGETVYDTAKEQIDDTIHELPDHVEVKLGDGLIDNLGIEANDLLDSGNITQQEEEDVVLEQIKEDYNFDDIKDAFDDGVVHESVYFFYGGESENFTQAVEFLAPNSDNRESIAFLLSDLGRTVMTSNRLSIHVESGDILYKNFNTGENFYNFLIAKQNQQAANIPKNFLYRNTFEACINNFLPAFSIDDVQKYDLFTNKNSKYLFY